MNLFSEEYPSLESYWRSVILFGQNVASYKFSLAKALLEVSPTANTFVSLEELSESFSGHILEHLKHNEKQITSSSSKFLDACKSYNNGEISKDQLINVTVRYGYVNVLDAFHVVNRNALPVKFFEKVTEGRKKGIVLTDDLFKILESTQQNNFGYEVEARWNLVETAWKLGMKSSLLSVQYDEDNARFFVEEERFKRTDITSARDALNGYQKGKCFYCFKDISVDPTSQDLADVDHFFAHRLKSETNINIDGVWNLVLSCQSCNRGANGKFALVPEVKYLERLHRRNNFFIDSHHPLRETLILQTGKQEKDRLAFLQQMDKLVINSLIHRWRPVFELAPVF